MRWLSGALVTSAVALSIGGCGSSGSGNNPINPGEGIQDASIPFDATTPGNLLPPQNDGSTGSEGGPVTTGCTPRTCAQAGATCGQVADGCGGVMPCGDCPTGQSCGGGATLNACGAPPCTPKTCADPTVSGLCGQQADGCGSLIAAPCVTCVAPLTCGGGGTLNACGGAAGCVPALASAVCMTAGGIPMNCGSMADGCGGLVPCGPNDGGATCPPAETCGGAGDPNVCGSSSIIPLPDGGTKVIDAGTVTSDAGVTCTKIPEGTACTGTFDGGAVSLCGPVPDGCGGTYTCLPACGGTDTCGGGGVPSVCGHPACVPNPVCTTAGATPICGKVSDGCGSFATCPTTCTGSDTCTGSPAVCTPPPSCTKLTCSSYAGLCGEQSDGCGGTTAFCNPCTGTAFCGGGGPSICGTSGSAGACDAGLLCDLPQCDAGGTTTLRGTIFDPAVANGSVTGTAPPYTHSAGNPLYDVVVYVPNFGPSALSHGQPSCVSCSTLYTGDAIVATSTDTDGNFTLTGVPVPTASTTGPWGTLAAGEVPIVIQIGKWRREWVWPGVTACGTTTATAAQEKTYLHLPGKEASATTPSKTVTNDDLPEIAVSTGGADSMECLFQRIGFASSEYVCGWNAGTGHIHIFQGAGGNTTSGCGKTSPGSLWDSDTDIYNYDILILSCEGAETTGAIPNNLHDFAQVGGRAFASHFHYSWFTPLESEAYSGGTPSDWGTNLGTWYTGSNPICPTGTSAADCNGNVNSYSWLNGKIVEALPDGGTPLHDWLDNVGALDSDPSANGTPAANELNVQQTRMNVSGITSVGSTWIIPDTDSKYEYTPNSTNADSLPSGSAQYFSWNTPIGGTGDAGAPYCGRIVYSDLHVGGAAGDYGGGTTTPTDCATGALTPQEDALEYMLLDLSSCVNTDSNLPPPTCTPITTCPTSGGVEVCGDVPNGCGGFLTCATCPTGSTCVSGTCTACTPLTTCPTIGGTEVCGDVPNGCGGVLSCATCPATEACIGGVCTTGCTPQPCPATVTCGPTGNGCGGLIASCGTCTGAATCGGGGSPGVCGIGDADTCIPQACPASITCGPTGDGCGGIISCGTCPTGTTCGGGGHPGVCGAPNCTPATCASLGANCGQEADGCGGVTAVCGTCTSNTTCGGGGTANVCGTGCISSTCASLGLNCGESGDGCGNVLQCGTCTTPDTCGGGGVANVCGTGGPK